MICSPVRPNSKARVSFGMNLPLFVRKIKLDEAPRFQSGFSAPDSGMKDKTEAQAAALKVGASELNNK